jgi:hypothetical protein
MSIPGHFQSSSVPPMPTDPSPSPVGPSLLLFFVSSSNPASTAKSDPFYGHEPLPVPALVSSLTSLLVPSLHQPNRSQSFPSSLHMPSIAQKFINPLPLPPSPSFSVSKPFPDSSWFIRPSAVHLSLHDRLQGYLR